MPQPASLKSRIASLIRADGPMTVSAYMQLCLHDPKHGYYATRPGLGTDFTTAPETSQIFGELLGLWAVQRWQDMGTPAAVTLAELGPGRGTLMADALRAAARHAAFTAAANLHLIEASPALRNVQAATLSPHAPVFVSSIEHLPLGHTIILANEYLDCLPVRQFVQAGEGWHERVIGLDAGGGLTFGLASDRATGNVANTSQSSLEMQPGLDTLIAHLADRAAQGDSFAALFIDYGPSDAAPTDTLRAYKQGKQVDPLACPGEADLTVDVDFGRLKRLAIAAGLGVDGPTEQGSFLLSLGAEARMQALIRANPSAAADIHARTAKLIDPAQMGARFKVLCLTSGR